MIEDGLPVPLGASPRDGGVNFAVWSPDASRVELCLFDAAGNETRKLDLPAQTNGVWHGFLPGAGPGLRYGYRAHGTWEPAAGRRFNPAKLLLDPYARALSGGVEWSDAVFDFVPGEAQGRLVASTTDSASFIPKSVVTDFSGGRRSQRRIPWSETLIYELNVRGYTIRHPGIEDRDRGRFDALGQSAVIGHLKALGVTTIELMPIHAFVDEQFLVDRGLRNFWGYNTLAFFAPEPRYLGHGGLAGLVAAIDGLHDAGFEVVLDVVFNHTAEGGRLGPTFSFRGLANDAYYRLQPDDPGEYINDTGCGNTINTDHAVVQRLIVDSLEYWVREIGVDGFRFDLATTLGRQADGFTRDHALFEAMRRSPALRDVKLIAEPWDIGPGGYQLGAFPPEWAEWNDRYRDTVRRFWRRDDGAAPDFARRVHGSADLFEPGGRGPASSINFVACHDGFTTLDLVSYAQRHNEANGEDNRDGHEHNYSENHGVEGDTADDSIRAIRRRHRLNLLATLLLSQGTPMLLGGDELGHSQAGNNNAYAQDNAVGWIDWTGLDDDAAFFDEIAGLVRLRRSLPLLRQNVYRHGELSTLTGRREIEWLDCEGSPMQDDAWPVTRTLGLLLSRVDDDDIPEPARGSQGRPAVFLLFNAADADCEFRLPAIDATGHWRILYASARERARIDRGDCCRLPGFSLACLVFVTEA